MTRSLPATIALPPSLASSLATRMNLLTSLALAASRSTKHFWLLRMVARITSCGIDEERRVERTHQRHRPFDQAGDFGEQAVVLDQFEALREGEILGVGADHVGAARGIEHHLGGFELGEVIVEAPHLDRRRRHEAMAARFVAGFDAVDVEAARSSGSSVSGPKVAMIECSGRTQVKLPAAPAHRLRPGKAAHHRRESSRPITSIAGRPCFSIIAT